MTNRIEELEEQLLDQTIKTYENSKLDLFDVIYDLSQYVNTTELEETWNKLVLEILKEELESVSNVENIKMGDLYVAGDAMDIHKRIEKDVYKLAQEREGLEL